MTVPGTPVEERDERAGGPAVNPGERGERKEEHLRDYVALLPLLILSVGGGAWLKAHVEGVVEWAGVVLASLTGASYLLKFVQEDTLKRARLGFVQKLLKSHAVARVAWSAVGAAAAISLFFSSVHVAARDDRTPITIFRMNGPADGAGDAGARVTLTKAKPSASFLVPIMPFGRLQWLRSSAEDRSPAFRLYPIVPRTLVYPDEFNPAVTAAVLPTGSFIADFGRQGRPRLIVRAEAGRGDTLATDSLARIEALLLSVGAAAPLDTAAMRPRWTTTVRERLGVDERDAQDQVSDWMRFRTVRTRRPLRTGETIGILVVSPAGDTLAADTLTLSQVFSDVILRRRID